MVCIRHILLLTAFSSLATVTFCNRVDNGVTAAGIERRGLLNDLLGGGDGNKQKGGGLVDALLGGGDKKDEGGEDDNRKNNGEDKKNIEEGNKSEVKSPDNNKNSGENGQENPKESEKQVQNDKPEKKNNDNATQQPEQPEQPQDQGQIQQKEKQVDKQEQPQQDQNKVDTPKEQDPKPDKEENAPQQTLPDQQGNKQDPKGDGQQGNVPNQVEPANPNEQKEQQQNENQNEPAEKTNVPTDTLTSNAGPSETQVPAQNPTSTDPTSVQDPTPSFTSTTSSIATEAASSSPSATAVSTESIGSSSATLTPSSDAFDAKQSYATWLPSTLLLQPTPSDASGIANSPSTTPKPQQLPESIVPNPNAAVDPKSATVAVKLKGISYAQVCQDPILAAQIVHWFPDEISAAIGVPASKIVILSISEAIPRRRRRMLKRDGDANTNGIIVNFAVPQEAVFSLSTAIENSSSSLYQGSNNKIGKYIDRSYALALTNTDQSTLKSFPINSAQQSSEEANSVPNKGIIIGVTVAVGTIAYAGLTAIVIQVYKRRKQRQDGKKNKSVRGEISGPMMQENSLGWSNSRL
ncbi:uncharacterized protein VTP21DRAFT_2535 [Calcarisporiella thermophila]|uniref:uncharacterized protein n=1 Tax=Calcarisporiella thermophila TaxID=911321 RepID=UPI003743D588